MQDWLSLFDFQNTRKHIYYYNHETRCVDQPCQSVAPWPVIWILARFHPRHIWCGKSLPNMDRFQSSLNIFANRIRWRWFFRDTPRQQFSICVPSHGRSRACTFPIAPSLDTWIASLKHCLTEVFIKSSRAASRDRSFCNKIPLVNFGLEILSDCGFEAVANDKDGGYSLVHPETLTNVHLKLLENGQYFETDFTNWDARCTKASMSYSALCKRVEVLEREPDLAKMLRKSLSSPGAKIEVQLVTSCKSHKPPGQIKFRNVHSAPRHAFAGLAIWSAKQHREQLKQFPTLYRDTRDFIHNISALKALPEHYFVRLDIEEFFMSGDPDALASDAAGLSEEGPRKRLLYDVDRFLLTHQFVASRRHPERLWRVQKGSGMGMKNSGELSDAAFAFLVERWCLKPDTLDMFAIDLYGRFKDDIIIVARNRALTKHFVWGMKQRSKYYKIKVEEVSDKSVKFLEVRVWKEGSRFITGPEFKPTSLWQPLGADSAHAPHCHTSWPAARLIMSRALSGNPSIFQKAKQELISRFISHFAQESVIRNLKHTDGLAAIRRRSERDGMWLVVGFHPVLYRPLRQAISRFQSSREMQECYEWAFNTKCPRIRIAWKNDLPAHRSIIYKTAGRANTPKNLEELR